MPGGLPIDILDRLTEPFFALDRDWRFTFANQAAVRLIAMRGGPSERDAILGRFIGEVLEPAFHEGYRGRYEEAMASGQPSVFVEYYPPFDIWTEVRVWPSNEGISVMLSDVTERKRADNLEARSARLRSLGLLAAGLAHDFNNRLTAILGNVAIARMAGADGDMVEVDECLSEAEEAAQDLHRLVQRMRTFAQGGRPRREEVDLGRLIREQALQTLRSWPVHLELELDGSLPPVTADPIQLAQVVENLVLNAAQSMEQGGTVQVRACLVGEQVRIEVVDEGRGIAPDDLAHVFDPFFSTRPERRGLGLATVHSIVEKHGGTVRLASERGAGTTATVEIPLSGT